MLKLLPRSQLKITITYDNDKIMKIDVKRRFLQHLENTPEIKLKCQEDKVIQYLGALFQNIKVPRILSVLIELTFSNARWVSSDAISCK